MFFFLRNLIKVIIGHYHEIGKLHVFDDELNLIVLFILIYGINQIIPINNYE